MIITMTVVKRMQRTKARVVGKGFLSRKDGPEKRYKFCT